MAVVKNERVIGLGKCFGKSEPFCGVSGNATRSNHYGEHQGNSSKD